MKLNRHPIRVLPKGKHRRPEFRTAAKIYKNGAKAVFVKLAESPEASPFLLKILQREKVARKYFQSKAKVVSGQLIDNAIYYPFLKYPTLEELILWEIKKEDPLYGTAYIKKYIRFLQSLDSIECYPEQFIEEFRLNANMIPETLTCLTFAPIDCIPVNILVQNKVWYIIDHEWTFDFPMPIDFLIYRGIYSLVIHLQMEIQSNASDSAPVTIFQGYGRNRTYIPCVWVALLKDLDLPVDTLHYWEYLFQLKIFPDSKLGRLRLEAPIKKESSVGNWSVVDYMVEWMFRFRRFRSVSMILEHLNKMANFSQFFN